MLRRYAEVSMARVLAPATGVVFVGAAVLAIGFASRQVRQYAMHEAEAKALIVLRRNLATHIYFSQDRKPGLFELIDPFVSEDYFDPTWMSSTYAVRGIDRYFKSLSADDYYYKESAINARNPENEADAFGRAFIEEMNADPTLDDRTLVRIYRWPAVLCDADPGRDDGRDLPQMSQYAR